MPDVEKENAEVSKTAEQGQDTQANQQAERKEPPLQNRLGELERKLAKAQERAEAAEAARKRDMESFRENLVTALSGDRRETDEAPPDSVTEQERYNEWVKKQSSRTADDTFDKKMKEYEERRKVEEAARLRREETARNVEKFKADNDWLNDPDTDAKFAEFVNRKIGATGKHGELTVEDLTDAAILFRKDEIFAQSESEVRDKTIRQMIDSSKTRAPRGRVHTNTFKEMSAEEKATAILSAPDAATQNRYLNQLSGKEQMAVLQLIDEDARAR